MQHKFGAPLADAQVQAVVDALALADDHQVARRDMGLDLGRHIHPLDLVVVGEVVGDVARALALTTLLHHLEDLRRKRLLGGGGIALGVELPGALGVLALRYGANPTQRAAISVRFSQSRRPATLLPIPRYVLRVGARDPCWVARVGRSNLLFWLDLGLAGFRAFLCTT